MKKKNPRGAGRKWFDGRDEKTIINKLEEVWALGGSDKEAAFFADISPVTLCEYLKSHPLINERKEALLERPVLLARRAIIESFDGHEEEREQEIEKNGVKQKIKVKVKISKNADMAMRYVERKNKKEFAPRSELTGQDGKPITVWSILTNEGIKE